MGNFKISSPFQNVEACSFPIKPFRSRLIGGPVETKTRRYYVFVPSVYSKKASISLCVNANVVGLLRTFKTLFTVHVELIY